MISILTISLFSIVIGFNIRNKNTKKSINNHLKDFTQKRNLEKSEIIIQTTIVNETNLIEIFSTEMMQITYDISITKYDYEYNKFFILATSQPKLSSDISPLVNSTIYIYSQDESKIITETKYIEFQLVEKNEILTFSKDFGNSPLYQIEIFNATVIHDDDNIYIVEILKGNFSILKPDTTNEVSDTFEIYTSNSSGKSYVWVIIVSIIGALILIGGFILIFRCINKRKKEENGVPEIIPNKSETDINFKKRLTFVLKLPNVSEIRLTIEEDKKLKDLAKSYLETINKPELKNEKSIYFMCDGKYFGIDTEELIGDVFKDDKKIYKVVISDTTDMIK